MTEILPVRAPYLGQVATGCFMPRNAITASSYYARTRDLVTTTEAVVRGRDGMLAFRFDGGGGSSPRLVARRRRLKP